jgi:hypothetical protein
VPPAMTTRLPITWGIAYGPGAIPPPPALLKGAAYAVSHSVFPDPSSIAITTSFGPRR